jgi:anti-sigma factor ChrR (cupin superfamily)
MMTEQQQEQAALFALGTLSPEEQQRFAVEVRANPELKEFLWSLQRAMDKLAMAGGTAIPPRELKDKVLRRVRGHMTTQQSRAEQSGAAALAGLRFLAGSETSGWKQLPVLGAWIKMLSFEPSRGYAVLLGKLDPGVRYPAHTNAGPEDFYILTGDLHVGEQTLRAGDFHHADAGSHHVENYSVEGCTLLAVLTIDDPLVSFAMT